MKKSIITCIVLGLTTLMSNAGQIFKVADKYNAYFSSKPFYLTKHDANIGTYRGSFIAYRSEDNSNGLVYGLTYQSNLYRISESELSDFMSKFVVGALSTLPDAELHYQKATEINGYPAVIYHQTYVKQGIKINRHAVSAYCNERLVTWSVQDYQGISTESAKTYFDKYAGYFLSSDQAQAKRTNEPNPNGYNLQEKIVYLEKKISELERRITSLERQKPSYTSSSSELPASEKWNDILKWRLLRKGMDKNTIRRVLGEPDKIDAYSSFDTWHYGYPSGGTVSFDKRNVVERWSEPYFK